jgi:hypothetical protein
MHYVSYGCRETCVVAALKFWVGIFALSYDAVSLLIMDHLQVEDQQWSLMFTFWYFSRVLCMFYNIIDSYKKYSAYRQKNNRLGRGHVPAFTGPSVGWDHNAAPNIKYDSSPIQYFKLFFTVFVVTLLVEELNLYCRQYYMLHAASSLPLQGITGEEMKFLNALILLMGHKKLT